LIYKVTLWLAAQTREYKTVTLLVSFLGFLQPAAKISGKHGLVSNFAAVEEPGNEATPSTTHEK